MIAFHVSDGVIHLVNKHGVTRHNIADSASSSEDQAARLGPDAQSRWLGTSLWDGDMPDLGSIRSIASRVMTDQQPSTTDDAAPHPHDFDVQKALHQQIRNDPDYDDWEYGTEPLPHEAWVQGQGQASPSEEPNR